jgi:hypothetical protein
MKWKIPFLVMVIITEPSVLGMVNLLSGTVHCHSYYMYRYYAVCAKGSGYEFKFYVFIVGRR